MRSCTNIDTCPSILAPVELKLRSLHAEFAGAPTTLFAGESLEESPQEDSDEAMPLRLSTPEISQRDPSAPPALALIGWRVGFVCERAGALGGRALRPWIGWVEAAAWPWSSCASRALSGRPFP
jgi:hypothetical protein